MTTTTAEGTTSPEIIEGEIVDSTEGPATDTQAPEAEGPEAPETPAGEENSSGTEVDVKPPTKEPEVSELSQREARRLADRIKKGLNGAADVGERMNKTVTDAFDLMTEAYEKKIWLALDEGSWDDFVAKELGDVRVRLDRTLRASIVYRMVETAHMSSRAIAPVLGVDQKTVSNDLRRARKELGVETPTKTQGRDGKSYEKPAAPRQRRQKPIEDRFEAAIEKADAAVGDLTSLSVEDGFHDAAGAIAKSHRAAVARLIDSLKGVQERLQ